MRLQADVLRAFDALAPVAEVSAALCASAGERQFSVATELRSICTTLGLPQARAADVEKTLVRAQGCGLFARNSALTWSCLDSELAKGLRPMLEGVHLYRSRLHRDEDVVDVVLTKPPRPSEMSQKLEDMLAGSWGLRDTRTLLPAIAESAKQAFTIMTPYLDETGAEIVINLYERTPARERVLILRAGSDGTPPPGLDAIRARLQSEGVAVLNFRIERTDAKGHETFHAKVVLADRHSAYVGSSNMLKWSFEHSLELGLYVQGKASGRIADVLHAVRGVSSHLG
jgi:phosphatidylserine/phosphatidylglycerophosphate/cardiolipin synthase-like enzyme